ncbi:unnamed protein product [Lampetra planeri]
MAGRPFRLEPVKEIVVVGGVGGLYPTVEVAYQVLDWSEDEALKALPMALNDEALAIFKVILAEWRTSLQTACREMVEVFDPPSNAKKKFQQCRRQEVELPLALRSALMVLCVVANGEPRVMQDSSPRDPAEYIGLAMRTHARFA